jgi:hypothetical protein
MSIKIINLSKTITIQNNKMKIEIKIVKVK